MKKILFIALFTTLSVLAFADGGWYGDRVRAATTNTWVVSTSPPIVYAGDWFEGEIWLWYQNDPGLGAQFRYTTDNWSTVQYDPFSRGTVSGNDARYSNEGSAIGPWVAGTEVKYQIQCWHEWQDPDFFTTVATFVVSDLNNPSSTSAIALSNSRIDLSWSRWNAKNVMIVRKKSDESWTEPTQGVAYIAGSSIGSGVVVYNSNGTFFSNTGLEQSTTYDYKFYSENNSYYSEGIVVSATTGNLSGGTYTVGPGWNFNKLNDVAQALNEMTVTGHLVFELQSNYVGTDEILPVTFNKFDSDSEEWFVMIRPASDVTGKSISGDNATAVINFDGGSNIHFDGRAGSTGENKDITIQNTNTSGVTIQFINDACKNTIGYCIIKGVTTSTSKGVVYFGQTIGTTGNDNNSINDCDVSDGASTPSNMIYSEGSSMKDNSDNFIDYCNIFNFWNQDAGNSCGIFIGQNNSGWTIRDNSLYQTAERIATNAGNHYGVFLSSDGENYSYIDNNFIGGRTSNCGGDPWTVSGEQNINFVGIYGDAENLYIDGNFISNFSWSSSSSSGTDQLPGVWCGIYASGGTNYIGWYGDNSTNTIGSTNGTGSVTISTSGIGAASFGIVASSDSYFSSVNNIIGSITATSISKSLSHSLFGIYVVNNGTCAIIKTTIQNLTALSQVVGIYLEGSIESSGGHLESNFIHSLASTDSEISASIIGIYADDCDLQVYNNMIRLGIEADGTSISEGFPISGIFEVAGCNNYFGNNSVYIGGQDVTGVTSNTFAFNSPSENMTYLFNNIFFNNRSGGETGKHYAIKVGCSEFDPDNPSSDYNIFYASGSGGIIGYYNADIATLQEWREATNGQDMHSGFGDPNFVNPDGNSTTVDLHVEGTTPAEGAGGEYYLMPYQDWDSDERFEQTPNDIGADAGDYTAQDIFTPNIDYWTLVLGNTGLLTYRTLSGVHITDVGTGINNVTGTKPRIWYRINFGDWASSEGTLTSGDVNDGYWSFTMTYNATVGDEVQYYVVAQDEASPSNVWYTPFVGASHTSVSDQSSPPSTPLSYTITEVKTWLGGTGSWNNGNNWNPEGVPQQGDVVIIPPTDNDPVVNSDYNVISELTISSGAKVTIIGDITVLGNLINESGTSGLIIQSGLYSTGSLVHVTSDVPATVQRYIPKYDNILDHMFHFLSSPVKEQAIREEFVTTPITAGHDFYSWDEENYQWINSKDNEGNWNSSFEDNFIVGKGYMVAYPDNVTKNFTGELNSYPNTSPLVVNCTHTVSKGNGWNLLGNPFPSSIDWDAVVKGDGMDNALYYYDAAEQNYRYYIQLGSIGSLGSGSRFIPPMQGFMVHAKSTGTKTITIHNDHRVHDGQDTWYKTSENEIVSVDLKVHNGEFSDETFIHFTPGSTPGFDGNYDALKLSSYNQLVPKLYTMSSGDKKLAINGLPELTEGHEIQLFFEPGMTGQQTISVELNRINTEVFLIDLKTGISNNLSLNPTYTFASADGDSPNRFLLKFSAVGIDENQSVPAIQTWFSNNLLFVNNPNEVTFVEIFDLTGRTISTARVSGAGLQSLSIQQKPGLYLIRLTSGNNIRTIKATIN